MADYGSSPSPYLLLPPCPSCIKLTPLLSLSSSPLTSQSRPTSPESKSVPHPSLVLLYPLPRSSVSHEDALAPPSTNHTLPAHSLGSFSSIDRVLDTPTPASARSRSLAQLLLFLPSSALSFFFLLGSLPFFLLLLLLSKRCDAISSPHNQSPRSLIKGEAEDRKSSPSRSGQSPSASHTPSQGI